LLTKNWPSHIIQRMSVKTKPETIQKTLTESYSQIPKVGDIIKGKVFDITKRGIFVNLNKFKTGVILPREFKNNSRFFKNVKVGDDIDVKIMELENEDGYVEVSLKQAGIEQEWEKLEEKMNNGEIIKAKVTKANKGGLMLELDKLQAFMPVSQLSAEKYPRVKNGNTQKILQALQKLVNETLEVKIIDLEPEEEKIIVSEKATKETERKETIEKYKVGDVVEGTVTGIVDFGVFIKFDNIEGLVHVSELAYQLVEDPQNVVSIGDKVKAKIIDIDNDKISLSIKALEQDPWENIEDKYKVGQTVKAKVTKFNPFGAFVQLDKYIHGLVHISEFGTEEKMKEELELGKKYEFNILSIKPKEYRMALKPVPESKKKPKKNKTQKEKK